MPSVLSTLEILLTASTASFTQEMRDASDSARRDLGRVGDAAGDAAAETESGFRRMMNAGTTAVGALAAGFAAMGVGAFVDEQMQAAKEMKNFSMAVGISANSLQKWQIAAQSAGLDSGKITDAMSGLNEKILDAAKGGEDSANMFKALGISVTDAAGNLKNSDIVMKEIATSFSKMEDGATKSAIASELMGDAGSELIPVLNKGSDEITRMGEEAEKSGQIISNIALQKIDTFNQQTNIMSQRVKVAAVGFGVDFLPAINSAAGAVGNMTTVTNVLKGVVVGIKGAFLIAATGVLVLGGIIDSVGESIGAFAAAAGFVIRGEYQQAWQAITGDEGLKGRLAANWKDIGTTISDMTANMQGISTETAEMSTNLQNSANSAKALQSLIDSEKKPEKKKKEKKEKEKPEDKDNFDYSKTLKLEFETWSQQMDADALDFSTKQYLELQKNAATIYEGMKADKSLFATELIKIDQTKTQAIYENMKNQSVLEWVIFEDDNNLKLNAAALEDEKLKAQSEKRLQMLRDELAAKRALIDADFAAGLHTETEATAAKAALDAEYSEKKKSVEVNVADSQRELFEKTAAWYGKGLDMMALQKNKAGKVARDINKAFALSEIVQSTAVAAMNAFSWGSKFGGPPLGFAAAAGAIAFGAVQAKAVMTEGNSSGGSASGPATPAMVVSGAQQAANTPPEPTQRTTIQIPADNLFTGRQMVDLLNEAIADGKRINGGLEFVGA